MKNDNGPQGNKAFYGNKKGMILKALCVILLLAAWIASGRLEAGAANDDASAAEAEQTGENQTETGKSSDSQKKGRWVKKDGYYYYYFDKKKKAVGYVTINGKNYLFDSEGRQMTGWRQVGKNVRYFRIKNGAKGNMISGKRVNGIQLDKNGAAKSNADVKLKISLVLRYQKLADRLVKPALSQEKKLLKVFMYARGRSFRVTGNPPHTRHWDQEQALDFIQLGSVDCVMAACGFAYLANAIGYKNIIVRLYGHGHCEIGDLCYDPTCARNLPLSQYHLYYGRKKSEVSDLWTSNSVDHRRI